MNSILSKTCLNEGDTPDEECREEKFPPMLKKLIVGTFIFGLIALMIFYCGALRNRNYLTPRLGPYLGYCDSINLPEYLHREYGFTSLSQQQNPRIEAYVDCDLSTKDAIKERYFCVSTFVRQEDAEQDPEYLTVVLMPSRHNIPYDGRANGQLFFYKGQDASGELLAKTTIASRSKIFWPGRKFSRSAYRVSFTDAESQGDASGNLIAMQTLGSLADLLKALELNYR